MFLLRYFKYLAAIFWFLTFSSVSADGLIVIPRPGPIHHPFPLEVVYHRVSVDINEQVARTSIDQSFYNPSPHRLEGYYIFPIPKGAVMSDFKMMINGKEASAELIDADKAKKIYEDIVRQMRDPALLEYSEQGLYKVRIFPIEPRSEKKISISYREILHNDFGMNEYIYPLNTEKFSSKPLKSVSIKIDLKSNEELKNIYSPSHEVDVIQKDDYTAVISYEDENVKPDTDFKLYYNTSQSKIGLSMLSYAERGEDGYFFISAAPSFEFDKSEISAKDITFVLDVSGSMAGDKLKQAKKALIYCVENLNDNDRFEIIRFSTEAYALFSELVEPNESNREKALKYIKDLKPVGGTNIEEALELALQNNTSEDRPHLIVFITDGKPTIGEMDEDKLIKVIVNANKTNSRIFTFGIGHEINTHLLDKITNQTKAARSYISPDEDIELKISGYYDKVQSPVLTDLKLSFSNNIDVYQALPKDLPDLFRGSNLVIFGRYKGYGDCEIELSGKFMGKKKYYNLSAEFVRDNDKHDFIPPLWASRRIGYLLDLIRLHGESKELVDEVTDLARTHGIVTPYTSYLIMEDERIRLDRREIAEEVQTLRGIGVGNEPLIRDYELDIDNMARKSGEGSVRSSSELKKLNNASNAYQIFQGKERMTYQDADGNYRNLTQQVKNIMGRAVYQNDKFWVDSELQKQENRNVKKIQFASDEYFELMNDNKDASQFLALGKNVRFYMDNTVYEVYE
ncbi:VIT domain-containing protein [Bacteroidota bacterium]